MALILENLYEMECTNLELASLQHRADTQLTIEGATCDVCRQLIVNGGDSGESMQDFEFDHVRQVFIHS